MKIGIDLDGVITLLGFINPSVKLPQWLYVLLAPIILLMHPCQKKELNNIETNGHTIIVVSARPRWFENLTKTWLKYHGIPFEKIHCVGFGKGTRQRKLKIIEQEKIEIFIENDEKIREFLNHNSIKTISSLNQLNGLLT